MSSIEKLYQDFLDAGKIQYANWLLPYLKRENDVFKIAVVGEMLKGKSTFINKLLGQNILPAGIIPSDCTISIKYGNNNQVVDEQGNCLETTKLEEATDECKHLTIESTLDLLKEMGVSITEYPGLTTIHDDADFLTMSEIYNSDGAILIVSAEQLLSITECNFLEYFCKYVSADRILVLINKLELVNTSEYEQVVSYAETKIQTRFPGVKYGILSEDVIIPNTSTQLLQGINSVKTVIAEWVSKNQSDIQRTSEPVLTYIGEALQHEYEEATVAETQDDEKRNAQKIEQEKQKQLKLAELERITLEFQSRRNIAEQLIMDSIRHGFSAVENHLIDDYNKAVDKAIWCSDHLQRTWEKELDALAQGIDKKAIAAIQGDAEWLDTQIIEQAHLDDATFNTMIESDNLPVIAGIKPYNRYKRYIPFGIGGSTVIGFCFFRMIGAAVCLAGGIAAGAIVSSILSSKEDEQDSKVKEILSTDIRKIKESTSKLAEKQILQIYKEIEEQFKKECEIYISQEFATSNTDSTIESQSKKLQALMQSVKEVTVCL